MKGRDATGYFIEAVKNAGYNEYDEILQTINDGADLNAQFTGGPALIYVADHHSSRMAVDIADILIESGADENIRDDHGKTALMHAAARNNEDLVMYLLSKSGTKLEAHDDYGMTALMHAADNKNAEATKLLIAARANMFAKNNDGDTALKIARRRRASDVEKLLLTAGAQE